MISEAYAALVAENERLQRDLERLQYEYGDLLLEIAELRREVRFRTEELQQMGVETLD